MLIIGVDIGGTLTDFIWQAGDEQGEYKLLSTPHNPVGSGRRSRRAGCGLNPPLGEAGERLNRKGVGAI